MNEKIAAQPGYEAICWLGNGLFENRLVLGWRSAGLTTPILLLGHLDDASEENVIAIKCPDGRIIWMESGVVVSTDEHEFKVLVLAHGIDPIPKLEEVPVKKREEYARLLEQAKVCREKDRRKDGDE